MRRRGQTEHSKIQCAIVKGCDYHPEARKILHVPNEGKMSEIAGAILNKEGRRKGVFDLHLPLARGGFHAMWMEVKIPGDDLTAEQRIFMEQVKRDGCHAIVVWTSQEGIDAVLNYLKGEK